jgi:hypothetical protein
MNYEKLALPIIMMIIVMGTFPIMYSAVNDKDTTSWTFIGHTFIASLLKVSPWFFLIAGILIPIYMIGREMHN